MKFFLILISIPSLGFCEGPLFRQKDPSVQQEFENIYQDLRSKTNNSVLSSSLTVSSFFVTNIASFTSSGVSLKGTTTNNNAPAGFIGEFIESNVTTFTNAVGSNTQGDLTSISLTAGDWDVSYTGQWDNNGATWTLAEMGFGTTAGNNAGFLAARQQAGWASTAVAVTDESFGSIYRLSVSATTTTYLKYKAVYSLGTPQAIGRISARRVR